MDKTQQAKIALSAEGTLFHFMSQRQRRTLAELLNGEEGEFFTNKVLEYAERVAKMPKTYETDGQGQDVIVHLHYFGGGAANFWITEKDQGDESVSDMRQHQAFGLANMFGGPEEGEIGYISIEDLIQNSFELDLYWEPKPLKELK